MKIGVTGAKGYLGSRLVGAGYTPISVDILQEKKLKKFLRQEKFDVIIHTAALTDVDYCQKYPSDASKVNVHGSVNLIDNFRGRFIYISTDHIFNGAKFFGGGYSEKHTPAPINIYGLSKYAGETMVSLGNPNVKIIRTSKLFDISTVEDDLEAIEDGKEITKTNMLTRSFLHVDHFVEGLQWTVNNWDKVPPILNISGTDRASYYHFYLTILRKYSLDETKLKPRNSLLKLATPRPVRGGLNVYQAKKLGVPLYSYREGIKIL